MLKQFEPAKVIFLIYIESVLAIYFGKYYKFIRYCSDNQYITKYKKFF